ncbi:DJ-1/PfpI family protein [Halalkalicoccus sp. NIPERK01]|uniref:DJ-1/PfpI family protein n=1 Tax=Halalkalicoccus sp. NIPERK01 TaxID=3053469 RepID=UPI00256F5F88|nr:DJ-1/PfpI family protein [Halalkalicoccus sp. NIPERK01]MDL5363864.1 DJ-1/PfpI family protein [Halalkalicoccus sp. NIPERK01]
MKIAFVVYEGMTVLDFVGIFDPVTRLKTMRFRDDVEWDICATEPEVTGTGGLAVTATAMDENLKGYDMIVVPGGMNVNPLIEDETFVEWLKTAADCEYKVSVCTGALLLGAAGFLSGRRATTHPMAFDELPEYATLVEDRIVRDGDVITARGVTASIDLGLYLCELLASPAIRDEIKDQMDYPYGEELFV